MDEKTVYDRRWWTLSVLCLSLVIVFVGNSSLNVALPVLSRELNATTSQLQWVVAIYSLVFAGLLFSTGALGDRYGRKGALQLGLALYVVGAGAATLSTAMWQLIACRAVMGAAAALIMPSTLSILINVFPAEERTKAIAIWASFLGAAGAIGPPISGWLLGHFWYGSIFFINVPLIAVALVAGKFLVPKSRDPEQAPLDPWGAVLSIMGIVALVYGLIQAPTSGWTSPSTLGSFAFAAVVLTVFVVWELHKDEPMLDMRYFRNRAFSTASGGMILVFLGMFGVMFLMTQYFQLVMGFSPLGAAIRLLPMTPIMLIVSPMTPRLSARFGAHRVVACGMLLVAFGFGLFGRITPHSSYLYVLLSLIPFISGMALTMSPMTAAIMSAVPARRAGAGSAMNDATRELGAALGVAVLGSLAASKYTANLEKVVAPLPAAAQHTAKSSLEGALEVAGHLPHAHGVIVSEGAKLAFVDGIHLACAAGVALSLIAAALVVRYLPATRTSEEPLPVPASASPADDIGIGVGVAPVPVSAD
ncbi:MAG TPA: MFS transporter [Acidimicrobiales bacterium]|nr:MFS transporter [Acidimicrobiales bacterium]